MIEDLRYAARTMLRQPGFALIVVLSLAAGIGATTTAFGVMNAVVLRPLPVDQPRTLVSVNKPATGGAGFHTISYPEYREYLAQTGGIFSHLLAWTEESASIELDGQAEQATGMLTSGNYFTTLGVRPAIGRVFTPADDGAGAHPVAVLGYGFWQRRLGSDASVLGRSLLLNGQSYTIIGVAPEGFTSTYAVFAPAFYLPLAMQPQLTFDPDALERRGSRGLKLTGRIRPGITRQQAEAVLNAVDASQERERAERGPTSRRAGRGITLARVGSYPPDARLGLLGVAALLLAIVGSVLLIACANVAGLLLARATVRGREIAVRVALGASRARLIRQLLTESCLLFLLAGALGVLLTAALTGIVRAIPVPLAVPFALDSVIDWRVLGFTLALALGTGTLFGLAPALEATRGEAHSALKAGSVVGGARSSRWRGAFVVAQVALSLLLLTGAGLFGRALSYGRTIYPGRQPETVMTATLDPGTLGYDVGRARDLFRRLTERVSALPGVQAVSLTRELYVGAGYATTSLVVRDAADPGGTVEVSTVEPGFFETVGIRLVAGRDFRLADQPGTPRVVIVNQALARRFWPGQSPLGKQLQVGDTIWSEVVGVAEDSRHRLAGETPPPFVYRAFGQSGSHNTVMTLLVRFQGDEGQLTQQLRRETRALDARLAMQSVGTLAVVVERATLPWRLAGLAAAAAGLIDLALAAMGVFGLVSFTASQRIREIGVRMALGARPRDILRLVLSHGFGLTAIGIAIGLALSLAATRAVAAFLFGISASDSLTYVGVSLLMAGVALAASWVPARRATRTDPLVALRHE